jgi:hypothetical protein
MPRQKTVSDGTILIATESFSKMWEGAPRQFVAGQTRVREGHPILAGVEHLFKPIDPHYEYEWAAATQGPGELRGEQ